MSYFVPRPYQHLIQNFCLEHRRGNIFASPGMGKTSAGVSVYDTFRVFDRVKRCLVLAPKRVAINSWPGEVEKWRDSFGHLKIAAAIGTEDQRLAALRSTPDILTINYDNIDWLMDQYGDEWPFDMVLADESTRLKGLRVSLQHGRKKDGGKGKEHIRGQGAKRAKRLADIAHSKVRIWYNLTGSPAPNGIVDCWGQQWFVDSGRRLGNSFTAFTNRWFRAVPGGDGYSQIEPMPFAQAEVEKLLAETSITVDARDWFDIDEVIESHVFVDLPPKARQQYKEMERELFTWIDEHPLEAFNAGAKSQKCLQLASGSVIVDTKSGDWKPVHDEKIEALKSIVEETNGENLLVAYQFKADLQRILKAFPKAKFLDSNPRTVKDFQDGKIRMLVCHPMSAGHGLDLQYNCSAMVDYSSGFNLEYDEQVIERIGPTRQAQIGKKCAVRRYRIVARDTVEHRAVLPALQRKMNVQDALKAAMKRTS